MTDRSYYVYLHRRKDTGEVFYVGKGTRTKKHQYARSSDAHSRNSHWKHIVAKHGYNVEVVADFFTEEDAFDLERKLIALHGKALCNLTIGGEGACGRIATAETKKRLKERFKKYPHPMLGKVGALHHNFGKRQPQEMKEYISSKVSGKNHPLYGKHHSPESILKMSAAQLGSKSSRAKKVVDTISNNVYGSVRDAAEAIGISRNALKNKLNGSDSNNTSMRYA